MASNNGFTNPHSPSRVGNTHGTTLLKKAAGLKTVGPVRPTGAAGLVATGTSKSSK